MNDKKVVLLSAGGTGGHLFPAIAIAQELQNYNSEIHLVTDLRCKKYITGDVGFTTYVINLYINASGIYDKIISVGKLLLACCRAIILVRRIKPQIIIGFGGYPSFPALFAGKLFNIPIVIQEQNCFLGKANSFFAKTAKLIALSYKETKNIDSRYASKLLFAGDVIRSEIRALPEKKNFSSNDFHIFIVGGSQGANIFTTLIPDAIKNLKKLNPEVNLLITQQVPSNKKEYVTNFYDKIGVKHEISEFFHDISKIYQSSQLVISRSGASTIAELTNIGLPAIFIPYPYAMKDHQYFNAQALANKKASWCYRQEDITSQILAKKLDELINNRDLLYQASKNLLSRKKNGTKILTDTVLKIID